VSKWERMRIADITPNPDNPRVIKDDKFQKLSESIRTFPQMLELRPIVINADGVVLGGNMRLRACQAAGLKEVPVIRADTLTPEQQREFIIKDNVGFGEWDWDALANSWDAEALHAWGVDTPWTADEIALPELDTSGEKTMEQMTFTLSVDQADTIREAIEAAKAAGPFVNTGNENSNGNALARIAEIALGAIR
jgi:ParB-like chromosome segregation protein Spo0J